MLTGSDFSSSQKVAVTFEMPIFHFPPEWRSMCQADLSKWMSTAWQTRFRKKRHILLQLSKKAKTAAALQMHKYSWNLKKERKRKWESEAVDEAADNWMAGWLTGRSMLMIISLSKSALSWISDEHWMRKGMEMEKKEGRKNYHCYPYLQFWLAQK